MSQAQEIIYTIEDLLRILPHRSPFLLLDRVVSLQEGPSGGKSRVGRKIVAIKNVTFNEPYFPGHFPHRPIMPGVLQVEAMAQAGAVAAHREGSEAQDVVIASVKNARFRRPVVPGDTLHIHSEITRDGGKMMSIRCHIEVDGERAAEAEMMAKVFPLPPQTSTSVTA